MTWQVGAADAHIFSKFQDCDATYSDSVYVEFIVDMGDEIVSDAGLFLAGGILVAHGSEFIHLLKLMV